MSEEQVKKNKAFMSVRALVVCALFAAMSIVFGKFLSIKIGSSLRISFENLPIILSGIFYGPVVGIFTAVVADIVGCFLYGYDINPIITLGAAFIGFISGAVFQMAKNTKLLKKIICSVLTAHVFGSMIIKSIGLYLWYGTSFKVLAIRIPIYLITSAAEIVIIYALLRNRSFMEQMKRMKKDA
ncbi:MAG: folate family ECF transporter S component [Ruminococcus sp.]|nr:folate family ECF transporter S component [Ruminococcus sp.]